MSLLEAGVGAGMEILLVVVVVVVFVVDGVGDVK